MHKQFTKRLVVGAAALAFAALATMPATAEVLFCNGTTSGNTDAFFIGSDLAGSCHQDLAQCFVLAKSSDVTTVSFGDWIPEGTTVPTTVTYKIFGNSACGFSGTLESSGTVPITTIPFPGACPNNPNGFGFDVLQDTFTLAGGGANLPPGTYFLQLDGTGTCCSAWDVNATGTHENFFFANGTTSGNPVEEGGAPFTFTISDNVAAPEMDANSSALPVALAAGGLLILMDRRRKKAPNA